MNWSKTERSYLQKQWDKGTLASIIGLAIGRSKDSVIGKARRMGLAKRRAHSFISWDEKQTRLLDEMWLAERTVLFIARRLNRSKEAIYKKRADLGLPPRR